MDTLIHKLAFIGGGNMTAALLAGVLRGGLSAERCVAADPSSEQRERLAREHGIETTGDNIAAAQDATAVVLAVKPQQMREVASSLAPILDAARPLVISVAAGIPHKTLAHWMGQQIDIVRAMPNRPALNRCGATGLYAPRTVKSDHRALAESLMTAVGATVWVEQESQMDTVTALSGSGPAYFFMFMEALEAAGRQLGLPQDVAHLLTVETAYGAAQMARQSSEALATLREQVTSTGGTTAAALQVLEAAGLRDIVARAVAAAEHRSAELAAEFGQT